MAVGLKQAGWSLRQIEASDEVQLKKSMVSKVLKRFREGGMPALARKAGSGRPRKIQKGSPDEDILKQHVKRENSIRLAAVSLEREEKLEMHYSTVHRAARRANLVNKGRRKKPNLTDDHRLARLDFAAKFVDMPPEFWMDWLFTDEKKFFVWLLTPRQWCEEDERPEIQPTTSCPPQVYVWGGISWKGRTPLHRIESGLTKESFLSLLQETMEPAVEDFARNPKDWWFQQDSTERGTHGSLLVRGWLKENTPHYCRPWPAMSPDLNPIENLWKLLSDKMRRWQGDRTSAEFWDQLQVEWENIPQEKIQRLILSMPRRLAAVIENEGRPTKY